ncbi:MAG: ferrous iron transport protein A [Saprospiraceae bacterium]|nr:ferrous iron transport protein A [Saprospiraceae bacterium]
MQRRYRSIPDLKTNESARALSFSDAALACKLTAMGVLPGARVEMVRQSPFGNAYYVKVDGVRLALRKEEADSILIEV